MSRCACPVCYSLSAGRGENLSAGQLSAVDRHVSDACTAAVSESRWCKLSSRFLFWMQDCTRPTCTTLSGVYLCVLESRSACLSQLWFDNIIVWLLHTFILTRLHILSAMTNHLRLIQYNKLLGSRLSSVSLYFLLAVCVLVLTRLLIV